MTKCRVLRAWQFLRARRAGAGEFSFEEVWSEDIACGRVKHRAAMRELPYEKEVLLRW